MIDYKPDHDLDRVAGIAVDLGERVREEDPRRMYDDLVDLCAKHPAKAAQLIMCFAVWFDPNTTTSELIARAQEVSGARTHRRSA